MKFLFVVELLLLPVLPLIFFDLIKNEQDHRKIKGMQFQLDPTKSKFGLIIIKIFIFDKVREH